MSRLNQATFDRYGEQQCIDNLPSLLDATAELTLREFGETGPWEYTTDGVSTTIENALRGRFDDASASAHFGGLNLTAQQLRSAERIILTACGTSWHAALVGEYLIEEFASSPSLR